MHVRNAVGKLFVALMTFCVCGVSLAEDAVNLKVGDQAPKFASVDDTGKEWKSEDHIGKKIVVVYFYPADLTGGCTAQACGFRDDMSKLKELGVEVVGVSGDSVKNHEIFKKDRDLNFTLLADESGAVAKAFGVPVAVGSKDAEVKKADGTPLKLTRGATAKRWTFIIDKDGKIAQKTEVKKAGDDSKAVIKFLEEKK